MTQFSKKEENSEYIKKEDFDLYTNIEQGEEGWWRGRFADFLNSKYFVPIVIILVTIIAFSLGRISGLQDKKTPVRVLNNSSSGFQENNLLNLHYIKGEIGNEPTSGIQQTAAVGASEASNSGQVVASKNGTKYHYPWCGGAKQISPQNLITFNSIEEARASGYTPAANCKGLK